MVLEGVGMKCFGKKFKLCTTVRPWVTLSKYILKYRVAQKPCNCGMKECPTLVNPCNWKNFGPNSKSCICGVRVPWGHVPWGLTVFIYLALADPQKFFKKHLTKKEEHTSHSKIYSVHFGVNYQLCRFSQELFYLTYPVCQC